MFGPTFSDGIVTIRKHVQSDIQDRFDGGFHSKIVEMYGGDPTNIQQMTMEKAEEWYNNIEHRFRSWVIEFEGRCVGHSFLDEFDETNKKCKFSIGLFSPNDFNKGIGTRACKLTLKYAFHDLRCHRVELIVFEKNKGAIKCYEKAGFRQEGVLRDNVFVFGKYETDIVMSILDFEFPKG